MEGAARADEMRLSECSTRESSEIPAAKGARRDGNPDGKGPQRDGALTARGPGGGRAPGGARAPWPLSASSSRGLTSAGGSGRPSPGVTPSPVCNRPVWGRWGRIAKSMSYLTRPPPVQVPECQMRHAFHIGGEPHGGVGRSEECRTSARKTGGALNRGAGGPQWRCATARGGRKRPARRREEVGNGLCAPRKGRRRPVRRRGRAGDGLYDGAPSGGFAGRRDILG